jgi:hypothetical protein
VNALERQCVSTIVTPKASVYSKPFADASMIIGLNENTFTFLYNAFDDWSNESFFVCPLLYSAIFRRSMLEDDGGDHNKNPRFNHFHIPVTPSVSVRLDLLS